MDNNREIPQVDIPEIEERELPEFEQTTPHPDGNDIRAGKAFSEVNELGHERNQAATTQKQMATQETAGVFEQ